MKLGRYLIGLFSGITFGVLFAPKKGKKLRDEIKKQSSVSGHDAFETLIEAFKNAGIEAMSEAKKLSENEQIEAAISGSKDKMKDYLSQLEETGYDVAAMAQEKIEELSKAAVKANGQLKKTVKKKKKVVKRAIKKVVAKEKKVVAKTVKKVSKVKAAVKKASTVKKTTTKKAPTTKK